MLETAGNFYIYSLAKSENMNKKTISNQSDNNIVLNKYLAYLLGVYLTDGYISPIERKFSLQVIDRDFAEQTLNAIRMISPSCMANIYERNNDKGAWNKNKQFCINAGFAKWDTLFFEQTLFKRKLPTIIYNAPPILKKWFVAGVMDGDGFITFSRERQHETSQWKIGLGKVEDGWILAFLEFMLNEGVKHHKVRRTITKNGVPFITLRFNHGDFIKNGFFFTIGRKQERLERLKILLSKAQRLNTTRLLSEVKI